MRETAILDYLQLVSADKRTPRRDRVARMMSLVAAIARLEEAVNWHMAFHVSHKADCLGCERIQQLERDVIERGWVRQKEEA